MSISYRFLPNLLTLSILSVFHTAYADAPIEVANDLPVTVVTASRLPEAINIVPASISVITQAQIQQSPARDIPSLLSQDASINVVQTGGLGKQSSIFTRGTNSNHTLVLLDGVSLNTADFGSAQTENIDLSDIKQIEILKGPAGVQYGAQALGGVVQLVSEKPTKQRFFGTIEAGSNNLSKEIVGTDLVQGDAYLQLRGQKLDTDGEKILQKSDGKSGYDSAGYSAKLGIEKEEAGFSAQYRANKGTNEFQECVYNSSFTCVGAHRTSNDFDTAQTNLKGYVKLATDLKINLQLSEYQQETTYSYGTFKNTNRQADLNSEWKINTNQNLLTGVQFQTTDFKNNDVNQNLPDNKAFYLQHQWSNTLFNTQAGVRIDDNDQWGNHTTFQLAGNWHIDNVSRLFINVGTGFRAPTAYDLVKTSFDPVTFTPTTSVNNGIKPEKSLSTEIGAETTWQQFTLRSSIYQNRINDLIQLDSSYNSVNIAAARTQGLELGLGWKDSSGLFARADYANMQARDLTDNRNLPRRPRQSLTGSAGWQVANYGVSAEIVAKGESVDSNSARSPIPGYITGNLRSYWQATPNVRVFGNIENISNKRNKVAYFSADNAYLSPSLQAKIGVTASY
ncbi:MAG: TonB-dependent receptor [Aquirhabdus sp.]